MRVKTLVAAAQSAAATGIALAQAPATGVAVNLNGATGNGSLTPPRRITLTGVGDVSAVTFLITGLDRIGTVVSESLVGPAAAATVHSAKVYASITSIVPQQTSANTFSAGWDTESVTPWLPIGNRQGQYTWKLRVFYPTGGAANYDVEATSQDMLGDSVSGDLPDDIVAVSGTQNNTNYVSDNDTPWGAVRLKLHTGGPATMRVLVSRTA